MKTFEELVTVRRSVRNYKNKAVPAEIIRSIINDSTMAPSSGNEQPWEFIVVSDRSFMNEISEDCKNTLLERIAGNPDDYAKKYEKMLGKREYNIFYNAPAVVFIVGPAAMKNTEINCTLAAGYFMFSAASRGLGTCWVSFAKFIRSEDIKTRLGLKPGYLLAAPIIIGYPESIPKPPARKPLNILTIG